MFEEYLEDAYEFLRVAEEASAATDEQKGRRYYRASIFCASSAMEAFVNHIADSFSKAGSVDRYEIAYLNDQQLVFSPGKGLFSKIEYHPIDAKLRVLMARFSPGFDFNTAGWSQFLHFKDLRDHLVHPRRAEDETALSAYDDESRKGLAATILLMNEVSKAVFHAPLRKHLLDLIPDRSKL